MAGFSQRLDGDWKAFQDALKKAGKINYQKMHEQMGEALVANSQLRFVDQVDPEGKRWKKGLKEGGQTLSQTGHLSSSITHRSTPQGVEVGTNSKYSAIHQFGGKIKAKKAKFLKFKIGNRWAQKKFVIMPKRSFIGWSKDDQEDIALIWQKTMEKAVKK